jgi:3-phenylpropionate/trans-cinnamate dioxygenase ferredoxin reductase subunit
MESSGVVIVGAGQAGYQLAASLRDEGYEDSITLIGEEPWPPYQRPPLSKGYINGKVLENQIFLRPATFYATRNIGLLTSVRVEKIERNDHRVQLSNGETLSYQHLVLATGAKPRKLNIPGADLEGVAMLRGIDDAQKIKSYLQNARSIAVLGAGFIGLEIAAVARVMNIDVHVLDVADRALKRAISKITADFLTHAQESQGVHFGFETGVESMIGQNGKVVAIKTDDGRKIPVDLVIVGIGVVPDVELAKSADLTISNGILVNDFLLTDDLSISAIGDCASFPNDYSTGPIRLESVQNAVDQARCVAARISGKNAPYRKVPWFWSDQGEYKLQIAGVAKFEDAAILRGNLSEGKFSVFRLNGKKLTAIESINQSGVHLLGRKLLDKKIELEPHQIEDMNFKLENLIS